MYKAHKFMPYTIPRPSTLPNWHLKEGTKNKKLTGGDSLKKVAATVSSWQTCSKHCPMFNKCYAKTGFHTRQNGNAVTTKGRGSSFDGFLKNIEDLRNNKVIGLVRGRMEFGPRALCNRSIIYKTTDSTINDWLNKNGRTAVQYKKKLDKKKNVQAF